MDVAGIEEQLCSVGGVDQGPRRIEIAFAGKEWVGIHPVHLDRHAVGPPVAEFGHRETGVDQQRPRAPARVWASFWAGITPIEKPA